VSMNPSVGEIILTCPKSRPVTCTTPFSRSLMVAPTSGSLGFFIATFFLLGEEDEGFICAAFIGCCWMGSCLRDLPGELLGANGRSEGPALIAGSVPRG
jgi:hypothetical protein